VANLPEPTMEFAELCALVGARLTGQGGRILVSEVAHAARANGHDQHELKLFVEVILGAVVEGTWYIQRAVAGCESEPAGRAFRVLKGGDA
jgi:hypothetical protein